jgi:hypothetical protein
MPEDSVATRGLSAGLNCSGAPWLSHWPQTGAPKALSTVWSTLQRHPCTVKQQGNRKSLGNKKSARHDDERQSAQKWLERLNVGSLQALGTTHNLEFNGLTLVERAIAVRLNRGEMDENVLAALALDESKALAGVKPLHCTLFFHKNIPFQIKSYLMHSFSGCSFFRGAGRLSLILQDTAVKRERNKKRPQVEPAAL